MPETKKEEEIIDTDSAGESKVADGGTDTQGEDDYGGFDPDDAVVQLATRHGFRPRSEYKGDLSKWIPPDKFIEAQWDINDAAMSGRKRLEHTVEKLTYKLDQVSKRYEEMTRREQEKAQAELKKMRNDAIEEGNAAKVDEIDDQMAQLKEATVSQGSNVDPAISEWMEQNAGWYRPKGEGASSDVREVIEYAEELNGLDEYQRLTPKFRLVKIDKEIADFVQTRHPGLIDKYQFSGIRPVRDKSGRAAMKEEDEEAKTRREISDVEGNAQRGGSQGKGKSYASLNENEKRACDVAIKSIPGMTREAWIKSFNEKFNG